MNTPIGKLHYLPSNSLWLHPSSSSRLHQQFSTWSSILHMDPTWSSHILRPSLVLLIFMATVCSQKEILQKWSTTMNAWRGQRAVKATLQHPRSPRQPLHTSLCHHWAAPSQSSPPHTTTATTAVRVGQTFALISLSNVSLLVGGHLLLNRGIDAVTMMVRKLGKTFSRKSADMLFLLLDFSVIDVLLVFSRKGFLHAWGHVSFWPWKWPSRCGRCQFAQYAAFPTSATPRCGWPTATWAPTTTTSHEPPTCKPAAPCAPPGCPSTQPSTCCRYEFSLYEQNKTQSVQVYPAPSKSLANNISVGNAV